MRVLIVEDEPNLGRQLRSTLEGAGYAVDLATDGEDGHYLGSTESYDAVILDLGLPEIDGLTVLDRWRKEGRKMPVLVLTARDSWSDKVAGLDAGADDYLAKPAELPILLARIGSLLRRSEWSRRTTHEQYEFGDTSIDFANLQLTVGSRVFPLTLMEANLLRYLVDHEGQAVSRKAMLEHVWGLRDDTDTRAIDNFLVRLRRYIEKEPSHPRHLLTVRGVGYRFVREPEGPS